MAKDPQSEFAAEPAADVSRMTSDGDGTATMALPDLRYDFFGHPRGLATLFFTELWERFSYYGMRALLVLYMTAATLGTNPGLGIEVGTATAIYGLYTFFVYVLSLPGGWVADNLWGQRRAVFIGGIIIALGHFSMAIPTTYFFFQGLVLIVLGTGLLKPNVSTMVGDLYPEGGARRDAGFSIFYMGINLGAILGPTLCGLLGEGYNWHLGFSLAGIGMVFGLVSYKLGEKNLGEAGKLKIDVEPSTLARQTRTFYLTAGIFALVAAGVGLLLGLGMLPISLEQLAGSLGVFAVLITFAFFAYIIFFGGHTQLERKRLGVIFWLFILAAVFWSGFEQAGSSLNLFAFELTDRTFGPVGWLQSLGGWLPALVIALPLLYVSYRVAQRDNLWWVGKAGVAVMSLLVVGLVYYVSAQVADEWLMPASFLQNINPTFIVLLAPVFGFMWTWLASRNANPSIPVKFALGLMGLAAGFFVLSWGAAQATEADKAPIAWLIVTYFLHTTGELCLSPVGLSSMTKLAPKNRIGQMMGIWFVAAALGNLFAGLLAGQLETLAPSSLFSTVAMITGAGGIVALLMAKPVKRLMGHVE